MDNCQYDKASAIREFLKAPNQRESFVPFHRFCLIDTINYLRYNSYRLKKIGSQFSGPDRAFNDIAIDILGDLYGRKNGIPFYFIFDYFKRHSLTDHDSIPDSVLLDHYRNLLFGFINKRLYKLDKEYFPQDHSVKRQFKAILASSPYHTFTLPGDRTDCVCLEENRNSLDTDKEIIQLVPLTDIVRRVFAETKTKPQLVAGTFKALEKHTRYSNYAPKRDLLIALITVFCSYSEEPYTDLSNDNLWHLRETAARQIPAILDRLKSEYIDKWIMKSKLTETEAEWVLKSANSFMEDYLFSSEKVSVRDYFCENFPKRYHDSYYKEYKNIFDTAISKVKEWLNEYLGDNL